MQQIGAFLVAHEAVLAGLGIAIIDLAIALSPALSGNGVLHQLYLWLVSLAAKKPQA